MKTIKLAKNSNPSNITASTDNLNTIESPAVKANLEKISSAPPSVQSDEINSENSTINTSEENLHKIFQ